MRSLSPKWSLGLLLFVAFFLWINYTAYFQSASTDLPPNVLCNTDDPNHAKPLPSYCQLPKRQQWDKFIWLVTDSLPWRWSQPMIDYYGNNSVIYQLDVPGLRYSHVLYRTWWSGRLNDNVRSDPATGDTLAGAIKRTKNIRLRYVGPEWSFLGIIRGIYQKTFDKLDFRDEPLDVTLHHIYPFFFENPGAQSDLQRILDEVHQSGQSLITHSAVLDHYLHGEYKQHKHPGWDIRSPSPPPRGFDPPSQGKQYPYCEAMAGRYFDDVRVFRDWIQKHPDYLLILSSDHGYDEDAPRRPSVMDLCATISKYLRNVDIPADSVGLARSHFAHPADDMKALQQSVAQLARYAEMHGIRYPASEVKRVLGYHFVAGPHSLLGLCGGTVRWDCAVGLCGGTVRWDCAVGLRWAALCTAGCGGCEVERVGGRCPHHVCASPAGSVRFAEGVSPGGELTFADATADLKEVAASLKHDVRSVHRRFPFLVTALCLVLLSVLLIFELLVLNPHILTLAPGLRGVAYAMLPYAPTLLMLYFLGKGVQTAHAHSDLYAYLTPFMALLGALFFPSSSTTTTASSTPTSSAASSAHRPRLPHSGSASRAFPAGTPSAGDLPPPPDGTSPPDRSSDEAARPTPRRRRKTSPAGGLGGALPGMGPEPLVRRLLVCELINRGLGWLHMMHKGGPAEALSICVVLRLSGCCLLAGSAPSDRRAARRLGAAGGGAADGVDEGPFNQLVMGLALYQYLHCLDPLLRRIYLGMLAFSSHPLPPHPATGAATPLVTPAPSRPPPPTVALAPNSTGYSGAGQQQVAVGGMAASSKGLADGLLPLPSSHEPPPRRAPYEDLTDLYPAEVERLCISRQALSMYMLLLPFTHLHALNSGVSMQMDAIAGAVGLKSFDVSRTFSVVLMTVDRYGLFILYIFALWRTHWSMADPARLYASFFPPAPQPRASTGGSGSRRRRATCDMLVDPGTVGLPPRRGPPRDLSPESQDSDEPLAANPVYRPGISPRFGRSPPVPVTRLVVEDTSSSTLSPPPPVPAAAARASLRVRLMRLWPGAQPTISPLWVGLHSRTEWWFFFGFLLIFGLCLRVLLFTTTGLQPPLEECFAMFFMICVLFLGMLAPDVLEVLRECARGCWSLVSHPRVRKELGMAGNDDEDKAWQLVVQKVDSRYQEGRILGMVSMRPLFVLALLLFAWTAASEGLVRIRCDLPFLASFDENPVHSDSSLEAALPFDHASFVKIYLEGSSISDAHCFVGMPQCPHSWHARSSGAPIPFAVSSAEPPSSWEASEICVKEVSIHLRNPKGAISFFALLATPFERQRSAANLAAVLPNLVAGSAQLIPTESVVRHVDYLLCVFDMRSSQSFALTIGVNSSGVASVQAIYWTDAGHTTLGLSASLELPGSYSDAYVIIDPLSPDPTAAPIQFFVVGALKTTGIVMSTGSITSSGTSAPVLALLPGHTEEPLKDANGNVPIGTATDLQVFSDRDGGYGLLISYKDASVPKMFILRDRSQGDPPYLLSEPGALVSAFDLITPDRWLFTDASHIGQPQFYGLYVTSTQMTLHMAMQKVMGGDPLGLLGLDVPGYVLTLPNGSTPALTGPVAMASDFGGYDNAGGDTTMVVAFTDDQGAVYVQQFVVAGEDFSAGECNFNLTGNSRAKQPKRLGDFTGVTAISMRLTRLGSTTYIASLEKADGAHLVLFEFASTQANGDVTVSWTSDLVAGASDVSVLPWIYEATPTLSFAYTAGGAYKLRSIDVLSVGIGAISPTALPIEGTASGLTIEGMGFTAGDAVVLGGSVTLTGCTVTSTSITCPTVPSLVSLGAGKKDLAIGSTTFTGGVTILDYAPTITGFTPLGYVSGGSSITYTMAGTNFRSGATVTIGATPCTVASLTATQITCTATLTTGGAQTVTVTNSDTTQYQLTTNFLLMPTIAAVSPLSIPLNQAQTFTITGTGLAACTVTIGGTSCSNVALSGTTSLTCQATLASDGAKAVHLVLTGNGRFVDASFTFAAQGAAPTVTGFTPQGYVAGGSPIAYTLTGTNFRAGATVTIGSAACTVSSLTATQISCTATVTTGGSQTVTVTNSDTTQGQITTNILYMPTITAVSPLSIPLNQPQTFTITGTGFSTPCTVTIGGTSCSNVVLSGTTSLTCQATLASAGAKTVHLVLNANGRFVDASFTFAAAAAPAISTLSPRWLPATGGLIQIGGTDLLDPTSITVGGAACADPMVTATLIVCTAGAGTAGTDGVTVAVTTAGGTASTTALGFQGPHIPRAARFQRAPFPAWIGWLATRPAPTFDSMTPTVCPDASTAAPGQTVAVTITGTGFSTGSPCPTVTVGGQTCTLTTCPSATQIQCTLAAGGPNGPADVVITNKDGVSRTQAGPFHFQGAVPTMTTISPAVGPEAGGLEVTLTGTGLRAGATVLLGTAACANVATVGAGSTGLRCTTGAGANGIVDVTVTNRDATTVQLSNGFAYQGAAPTLTDVSPATGLIGGGTELTLTGTNFRTGVTVTLGGVPCHNPTLTSATRLTCTTAPGAAGVVAVVLANTDLTTVTKTNGFTYVELGLSPDLLSITPAAGPQDAATGVTLSGSNFRAAMTVTVGGQACTGVNVTAYGSQATCTVAAGGPNGPADVVLTNADGTTSTATGAFVFTGPLPTVTGASPSVGPQTAATALTLTGTNFRAGATVTVGDQNCTGVAVTSATSLQCNLAPSTSSPAANGPAQVVVTNVDTTAARQTGLFFFQGPAPTFDTLTPDAGVYTGATPVVLTGTNIRPGAYATFGGRPCINATVISATQLACLAPLADADASAQLAARTVVEVDVDVALINADMTSDSLEEAFTYGLTGTGSGQSMSAASVSVTVVGSVLLFLGVVGVVLLALFLLRRRRRDQEKQRRKLHPEPARKDTDVEMGYVEPHREAETPTSPAPLLPAESSPSPSDAAVAPQFIVLNQAAPPPPPPPPAPATVVIVVSPPPPPAGPAVEMQPMFAPAPAPAVQPVMMEGAVSAMTPGMVINPLPEMSAVVAVPPPVNNDA
ncbi:putative phospholipase D [Paratrimastix pyriformis]|uniref:Phospholipase D n=1 Tax=Paratrimastix pyriformis TaxID=342808 RepID=A0ABQ8URV9_9EUKA|nr:putative phospholipase D [Paratrimastix pyriformis]